VSASRTRRKSRAKALNGWQAPGRPPPDTQLLLLHASSRIAESDTAGRRQQLEARRALATLYRAQLIEGEQLRREVIEADAQMGGDAAWRMKRQQLLQQAYHTVDPQLRPFLDGLSLQIWSSDNPVATLQALLYGEPTRGKPSGNHDYRDFVIAAKVAYRMRRGEKRDAACAAVAQEPGSPGTDAVLNIYKKRNDIETKVQVNIWERKDCCDAQSPKKVRRSALWKEMNPSNEELDLMFGPSWRQLSWQALTDAIIWHRAKKNSNPQQTHVPATEEAASKPGVS